MIAELLYPEGGTLVTGRELARMLRIDIRTVTQEIQRERIGGAPIAASQDPHRPGYYLATTRKARANYVCQLRSRSNELQKVIAAIESIDDEKQENGRHDTASRSSGN